MSSFADLGVSTPVADALAAAGFHRPFAIQRLVIGDVLAGRDVLAKSPTGSGKTLAFAVPIVDRIAPSDGRPAALVLAPTRELAAQIVDDTRAVARARGLEVAAVYGGVGFEKQIRAARRAHVLVATPGRLEDLLARGAVSLARIRILVLDEADRMLDMGFRPAVDRIVERLPGRPPDALLLGHARRRDRPRRGGLHARRRAPRARAGPRAEGRCRAPLRRGRARAQAVGADRRAAPRRRAHAGVRAHQARRRPAGQAPRRAGVEAVAMHGDKSQRQREPALARFEAGNVRTLVATDVAARGIDVEGIEHVINFDPPADREGYVHRVGRTGRAGRTGVGTTFVRTEDAQEMGRIAAALELHDEFSRGGFEAPARRATLRAPPRRRAGGGGGDTVDRPRDSLATDSRATPNARSRTCP